MNKAVLILFSAACSLNAVAQSAAEQLGSLLTRSNSFAANFQQTVSNGHGQKSDVSHGRFELQHPGKFRWEVKKPYHQVLVSTGKVLWIYEPDIDSVTVNDLEQELGATPALLLSSDQKKLVDSFHVQARAASEFVLTPKDLGANFEQITLRFANNTLVELNLQDSLGGYTQVLFTDAKSNVKLEAGRFEFTPPANADVIDNRRQPE